jgi:hypothetical protein
VLAYNLGNFMRTLALPKAAEPWSLTSLREKLIKIGAKVVRHGRYLTFQMAEVAVSRQMFAEILSPIARLRGAARASMRSFGVDRRGPTTGEVRLGDSRPARSRGSERSTGWFDHLLRRRGRFGVVENARRDDTALRTTGNPENVSLS